MKRTYFFTNLLNNEANLFILESVQWLGYWFRAWHRICMVLGCNTTALSTRIVWGLFDYMALPMLGHKISPLELNFGDFRPIWIMLPIIEIFIIGSFFWLLEYIFSRAPPSLWIIDSLGFIRKFWLEHFNGYLVSKLNW